MRSMDGAASEMNEEDLQRLAGHLASAAASARVSPDAAVMGIGVLVLAARRLAVGEAARACLEAVQAAPDAPEVVRAAAAWAQEYLQAWTAGSPKAGPAESGEAGQKPWEAPGRQEARRS